MKFDVCVYGGSSAGVVAAVAAARRGKKTALVNPGAHLGGMSSGGLGATDMGNAEVIGGMAREFYRRVGRHYGVDEQWRFEPHVAEKIFREWLEEAGVTPIENDALKSATKRGAKLESVTLQSGKTIEARAFIDCSYEGDLMAAAGVSYALGRESREEHGEELAGVRPLAPHAGFKVPVDAWDKGGLLSGIEADDGATLGAADQRIQAYNYRLCLTQDENLRIPITAPKDYDARRYELLARYLQGLKEARKPDRFSGIFLAVKMPHGKTDFNNYGGFSTDLAGGADAYPEAGPEERRRIAQRHEDHIRGIFHFLATDSRVARHIQREAQSWGLCRDEFQDSGGWPHQLYVREARRMKGAYTMTEADCLGKRVTPWAIGMGSYTLDSHLCRRIAQNGAACNEGSIGKEVEPYPIAYDSLVPQASECENLLVPVCLSATHVAFGSIRMEPVYMLLAHAAGAAASLALEGSKAVQSIDRAKLCAELAQEGQVLSWARDRSAWNKHEWPHDPYVVQSFLWWHE